MKQLQSTLAFSALLALAVFLGGCDEDAPTSPTWIDDVQPQVLANCVRCHSYPSRGGAPDTFRLDVYRSTYLADGTEIRGAEVMAEFMKQRAGTEGSMPPDFARADHMRGTFKNWFDRNESPARGSRANNTEPQVTLLTELPVVDKEMVRFEYEVADRDGDVVHGRFTIGGVELTDRLHTGRGTVEFYSGTLPEGDLEIVAEMSDGRSAGEVLTRGFITTYPLNRVIGTLRVSHADGNRAPTVSIVRHNEGIPDDIDDVPNSDPNERQTLDVRDIMVSDIESPLALEVRVMDLDPDPESHTVSVVAFRGENEVEVASSLMVVAGSVEFDWDTTSVPEGPGWRLRVTATDSRGGSHTIETGRIFISHHTTAESWDSVSGLFNDYCGDCHIPAAAGGYVPYFNFTLGNTMPSAGELDLAYEVTHHKVGYNIGNIYKRLVEDRNMPPTSAAGVLASRQYREIPDEDRDRMADYLLGGGPRR